MKLYHLHESIDLLQRVADFDIPIMLYSRDGSRATTPDEIQAILDLTTKFFSSDPSPGITPIQARAVSVDPGKIWPSKRGKSHYVVGKLRTTVEEFIRMEVKFGTDPYETLHRVKDATDTQTAAAAHEFLRSSSSSLRVAMLGDTVHNIPAKPDL